MRTVFDWLTKPRLSAVVTLTIAVAIAFESVWWGLLLVFIVSFLENMARHVLMLDA